MANFLPPNISLKCYQPNGIIRYDYTREPELKLVTTDEINCGYADADFDLCDYYFKLPLFGDKIVVKDELRNEVCWVGEISDVTKDVGVKAHIKCLGYGKTCALDLPYAHGNVTIPENPANVSAPAGSKQVYAAGTSYATIIGDTFTRTQNIVVGSIVDLTGITIPEDSRDYIGLSPAQIWNELSVLTGILATPLMWFVRGDLTGGDLPSFYMRYMGGVARLFVTWDNKLVKVLNDSYERDSYINGCTVAYGSGLQWNHPDDASIVRDHSVLPTNHDRDKFVNANNNIKSTQQAQQLAQAYVARFGGPLASTRATVEICGGTIKAIPNVVPVTDLNYPFWLLVSGLFIDVANMPAGDAPYDNSLKFITRVSIDYSAGKATCETGVLQGPSQSISIMETYLTSRPYQATNSGQPSEPYVDQDTTPAVGTPSTGLAISGTPLVNDISQIIPKAVNNDTLGGTGGGSLTDPDKPHLPYDAALDPRIIADYGIMGNYESDGALGIKGLIQVIPGRILAWKLYVLPGPGDVGNPVPNETIDVVLYTDYPALTQVMGPNLAAATVSIAAAQQNSGVFSTTDTHYLFTQAGTIGVKVTTAMGDTTRGFHLTLYGPKSYPDLDVKP